VNTAYKLQDTEQEAKRRLITKFFLIC